ncbi:major histocompatibility complex class I-related gene protein-like [Rana temporaria]|uniref:major histocompatibility complex class I-related gene protein-like n=1 Tax=Rana temporaria TaxID=8407 RepID=UPI001AACC14E|nr:major histocompatibility complex class I-related gene protein-like [Rana temporaria]
MMERYILFTSLSVILFPSSPIVSSDSHSHFFFTTVTNDITNYYPTYYSTRSIDDITLYWYDSNNEVIERRVPWFRRAKSTLLDASISEFHEQQRMQNVLQMLKRGLNDTEGFHILQLLDGCVLYDNGTFDTLYRYHYDGKPFLSFNVKEASWIAEDPKAQYLTNMLNVNETKTQEIRNTLVKICVPHIHELLSLGTCTFNRREPPVVIVTQMLITNSTYRLNCQAYGHYPKTISMTWYKNDEPISESLMERVTLPLPDITYLTWLLLNITLKQDDVYTCSVTHSSLTSPLMAEWRLSGESSEVSRGMSNGRVIALCVGISLLVVLTVFGAVSIAKSRRQ